MDLRCPHLQRLRFDRAALIALFAVTTTLAAASAASAQATPAGQQGTSAAAQSAVAAQVGLEGRPVATAVRTAEPPVLDGRLDDPIWLSMTPVSGLVQRPGRRVEGAPASENTEVYIAYDDERIYFGIHAYHANQGEIRASRVDRDQIQPDDKVTIYLDPFLDLQRAYGFAVNPYGVQRDAVLTATGGPGGDPAWNALYETRGRLTDDGWTAEMAIPFKSLRYPGRSAGEVHRWGLQIERDIESKNEAVTWAPIRSNVMGFITQMGVLDGMTNLSTNRNLELLPTVTAIQIGKLDQDTGDFGTDGVEEVGLNVKYGLTPNLTADFTLNPDFSQIESDRPQIEVNQRFPLFFPELRPFFLEGQEIYEAPGPVNLLHTRTILDPRYGGKLSGKTGRTTLAVLVADDEAPGKVIEAGTPGLGESANVFAARAKFDLHSRSYVGAIFTNRDFLDSYSRLGGVDGDLWFGRAYRFSFRAVGSDRRRLNGVRQTGPQWNVAFRQQSRNLNWSVIHHQIDPEFGTDLGFVRRVNERLLTTDASYTWYPGTWVVNWGPSARFERGYLYRGGPLQDETIRGGVGATFTKNISVRGNVERILERFREIDFEKTRYSVSGSVNTSRKVAFEAELSHGDQIHFSANPFLGRSTAYEFDVTLRPTSRLQSEVELSTDRFIDPLDENEIFDVKILHAVTTYQFTDRLLVRNILDHNTFDETLFTSFLLTYRVNSGTVFFVGYDDHHRQGDQVNPFVFRGRGYERTNRAVFMKLQYLFRY